MNCFRGRPEGCNSRNTTGVGCFVHIYDLSTLNLLHSEQIYEGLRIYGIEINENHGKILFHAENEINIYDVDWKTFCFNETTAHSCFDWILASKWIDSGKRILTVSMHNFVEYWDIEMNLIRSINCEEKCILYCAHISFDTWDEAVVFSGTVFSEVLLWKPGECTQGDGVVVKRLVGHKGVLFSIHHNPSLPYICSTSDDRSVILWKIGSQDFHVELQKEEPDIKMVHVLYGHTARVFGCKILNEFALSIGEDGILNVWDFKGHLVRKVEAHQGGCIWSLDYDDKTESIVTGGGDSAVVKIPLQPKMRAQEVFLNEKDEIPKHIVFIRNGDLLIICESGSLLRCIGSTTKLELVDQHEEFRNYSLLEVSECRNQIVLCGFKGHIFIYTLESDTITLTCRTQTKSAGRIFSVHFLTCSIILTCETEGLMSLWKITENKLVMFHLMQLPKMKERWTTAACICNKNIVIGDRKGNVHLFDLDSPAPLRTIKKAHSHLGVTNVLMKGDYLITLGRNCLLRKFKSDEMDLVEISSDKLPFTWLAAVLKTDNILLGFSGKDLLLWDCDNRRILWQYDCGGGHRSWDFLEAHERRTMQFGYVKDKAVHVMNYDLCSLKAENLIRGFHVSEVNTLKCLRKNGDIFIISGGEDTTLRLCIYKHNNLENLNILKSHLSSIRCLTTLKINECKYLLISAGGRAQIILWEILLEHGCMNCKQLHSYYESIDSEESEVRIMDLCAIEIKGTIYLYTACSDGKIKIYTISDKLNYLNFIQYKLKCILKIATISVGNLVILVSMATDGSMVFWNLSNYRQIYSIKCHQSGINSFHYKQMTVNTYGFITGGDDNCITINFLHISDNLVFTLLNSYSNSCVHSAQITGVYLTDRLFISVSLDQSVKLFKYYFCSENNEIITKCCGVYYTSISDIKGMDVLHNGAGLILILYGLGIEVVDIN